MKRNTISMRGGALSETRSRMSRLVVANDDFGVGQSLQRSVNTNESTFRFCCVKGRGERNRHSFSGCTQAPCAAFAANVQQEMGI